MQKNLNQPEKCPTAFDFPLIFCEDIIEGLNKVSLSFLFLAITYEDDSDPLEKISVTPNNLSVHAEIIGV